jgi:WD40 repeat protein
MLEDYSEGRWQLKFSPSGTKVLVGKPDRGFQVYESADGRLVGPPLGSGAPDDRPSLLGFSADEQVLLTGGAGSIARFWRVPNLPARNDVDVSSNGASIWPPSGDAVVAATPDATTVIIGDQRGDVHVLPAQAGQEALVAKAQDVSFFGHNAKIRSLTTSRDGSLVVSTAEDNTLRVWNVADGLPRPFIGNIPGEPIGAVTFSADASMLGVLNGQTASIMNAETGEYLARFDLGERHRSLAFADSEHLYVGSESGTLRVISRQTTVDWGVQNLWQGSSAIRWLEASPRAQLLVLVDENNLAQQFSLTEGQIGETTLALPSSVEDVVFTPAGLRVLFRTANWVHRASTSVTGLVWTDAMIAPKAIPGSRIVFGNSAMNSRAALGSRLFLPVAGDGRVRLAELNFVATGAPGLFGNKDQLIAEWRSKLAIVASQGPDE